MLALLKFETRDWILCSKCDMRNFFHYCTYVCKYYIIRMCLCEILLLYVSPSTKLLSCFCTLRCHYIDDILQWTQSSAGVEIAFWTFLKNLFMTYNTFVYLFLMPRVCWKCLINLFVWSKAKFNKHSNTVDYCYVGFFSNIRVYIIYWYIHIRSNQSMN